MIKRNQKKEIDNLNKQLCSLLERDNKRDINQVYEDTRYAGI